MQWALRSACGSAWRRVTTGSGERPSCCWPRSGLASAIVSRRPVDQTWWPSSSRPRWPGRPLCRSASRGSVPSADLIRSTPRLAALGGLLVLAICGFARRWALETLVLVGLDHQPCRRRCLARLRPAARQPAEPKRQSQDVPPPPLPTPSISVRGGARACAELSDEEICLSVAGGASPSFRVPRRPTTGPRWPNVRRAYLDELERRSPRRVPPPGSSPGPEPPAIPAKFFIPHTS